MGPFLEDKEILLLRKRTRRWIGALFVTLSIWLGLLIGVAVVYGEYRETCEYNNTFGRYALVLSIYVLLLNTVDIIMACLCLQRIRAYISAEIMPRWTRSLIESQQELLLNEQCTEGYELITDEEMTQKNIATVMDLASTIRQKRVEEDLLADFHRKQENLQNKIIANNESLETALLHIPKWTSKKTRKQVNIDSCTTPAISKLLFGTSVVPVMAILFFVITGMDAVTLIRQKLGLVEGNLPRICLISLTLNWSVLTYALLLNVLRAVPLIIVLWRNAVSSASISSSSPSSSSSSVDATIREQIEETGLACQT